MDIKTTLKNPNVYYIAAPVLAALWAVLAGIVFYPGAVKGYEQDVKPEYEKSQELIEQILTLQPERLQFAKAGGSDRPFDFGEVVTTLTGVFDIPTTRYTLNVRGEVKRGKKNARSASMEIKEIDVARLARFLATMLTGWPDLECEKLSLEKAKTGKDNWNADMTLTYYY